MTKIYLILLITLLTIVSCGKSKEQLELEKVKLELEKAKLEITEKTKSEEKAELELIEKTKSEEKSKIVRELYRVHEQKSNVGKQKKQTQLNDVLIQANTALTKAKKNYENAKVFQFGRTESAKDKQLTDALNQINILSSYIENIKNEIAELELSKTFDFQKNPENVVKHLFSAAKNKDFSKLRYLCDPYAENDSDTRAICYTEMLPQSEQDKFIQNFENGRLIGKAIIKGDRAVVEFAYGQSSDRLEKMNLVNRMGNWYFSGI